MDVLKSLGADSHQRMMFWPPKANVPESRKMAYARMIKACVHTVTILRIFFRMVTKKFKLPQYFYWYDFLNKNEMKFFFFYLIG